MPTLEGPRLCRFRAAAGIACTLALSLVPSASPALADREPVLKQIGLPHPYYYREMYLPQATSGPGSVDWSPDGREVVVSMQGSLWRHVVGTAVATQITNGHGYDYQPDWSPDGRLIAFASYRDDAVELRLLDVATGAVKAITTNGAVNVEPRWSPDGTRLAFVSTIDRQRFHIHLITIGPEGSIGPIEQLTDDHDSGLPRYYYSRFDHFISPTWSPDGSEIIFISNGGHIHGTGGFFRMKARPGARAREIRYEETTWKARPDWSPDGHRVVYSSYLGRQWQQLWLMTDQGGDPFPISYGEFDATNPRWSPDGKRIAYISNEGGNTALVIQDLPGGRRRREELKERRYLGTTGHLRVIVADDAGRTMPARISVTGADGRGFAPDDAWRHADDGFDRSERRFEYTYFHTKGASEMTVPEGVYTVEVTKGLEYRPSRRQVRVREGGVVTDRAVLSRLADPGSKGWRSGDLHVHMNYAGTYRNDPKNLAFQAAAEGLNVVESLIVNKEQRIPDIAYFTGRPDPVSTADLLIVHGQEYHTSYWGHAALLGLTDHFLLPAYAAYVNTPAGSLYPLNAAIFDLAHDEGALTGYVHPYESVPDPSKSDEPLHHELPVDAALGKTDYLEVVGFSDHLSTAAIWYRLLNCGFRLPAGAGTDAMANYASLRGPLGVNRVYVKTGPTLDHRRWMEGIRSGRTFATNGPLLEFALDGKEAGETLALSPGRHEVQARAALRSIVPVDHLQIVGNGAVVADLPLAPGGADSTYAGRLAIERSGWYTLRAWSKRSTHPVLDIYPFGTTSPIYVSVVGAPPPPARADADYFIAWIDRLADDARADTGWNDDAEKEAVLETLRQARTVYERIAGSGG